MAATLVAGVVSAAVRTAADPGSARLAVRQAGPAPVTTPPPPLPTPTSTPTALPTPKPAPTVRPTLVPTPTLPLPTSAQPTIPVTEGGLPTTPALPPAQQGHWRHTQGGVTIDVRISPTHPKAGDLVTWTVAMSSEGKRCCNADLSYGDGHGAPERNDYCLEPDVTGTAKTEKFRHAYRTPGVYTAWVNVGTCSGGGAYLLLKPKVVVAAGPLLSNGPWQPVATVDDSIAHSGADPDAGQYFVASIYDHDGFPVTARWDWGDGAADTVDKNDDACWRNPRSGWPEGRMSSYVAHTFPEPGTYTVRVTGTTRGCDGRQPQTVTATMTWTVD